MIILIFPQQTNFCGSFWIEMTECWMGNFFASWILFWATLLGSFDNKIKQINRSILQLAPRTRISESECLQTKVGEGQILLSAWVLIKAHQKISKIIKDYRNSTYLDNTPWFPILLKMCTTWPVILSDWTDLFLPSMAWTIYKSEQLGNNLYCKNKKGKTSTPCIQINLKYGSSGEMVANITRSGKNKE